MPPSQHGPMLQPQRSSSARMFISQFPRSPRGNFRSYHGNRFIPGETLLLPAPSPPPHRPPPSHPPELKLFSPFERFQFDFLGKIPFTNQQAMWGIFFSLKKKPHTFLLPLFDLQILDRDLAWTHMRANQQTSVCRVLLKESYCACKKK